VGEGERVSVIVPNLFLRVSVEAAVKMAGYDPVASSDADQALRADASVVIADLDALGDEPESVVHRLAAAGKTVLAFGPHVKGEMLASARAAGAVVLPRSAFLERLPELLRAALPAPREET
jgi:hypothetical protein